MSVYLLLSCCQAFFLWGYFPYKKNILKIQTFIFDMDRGRSGQGSGSGKDVNQDPALVSNILPIKTILLGEWWLIAKLHSRMKYSLFMIQNSLDTK